MAARAHGLGMVVADEPEVMDELLQEFFTAVKVNFSFNLGGGIASKSTDLQALWEHLVEGLELAGNDVRGCSASCTAFLR